MRAFKFLMDADDRNNHFPAWRPARYTPYSGATPWLVLDRSERGALSRRHLYFSKDVTTRTGLFFRARGFSRDEMPFPDGSPWPGVRRSDSFSEALASVQEQDGTVQTSARTLGTPVAAVSGARSMFDRLYSAGWGRRTR